MPKQLVVIITIAIALVGAGGIVLVAVNQNRSSPVVGAEASTPPKVATGGGPSETVRDSTNENRRVNKDRKVVIPTNERNPILVDVPDSKIDHAALEEFIEKRPMDAYRIVQVDSDALRAVIRQVDQQPSFELQLLSPSSVTLVARDAEEYSSGWRSGIASWGGTVAGEKYSDAMFVVAPDGSVRGDISSRVTGLITIESIPNTPYHIVWRLEKGFKRRID